MLASGDQKGCIYLWNLETGFKTRSFRSSHTDLVTSLKQISSTVLLSASKDKTIKQWNLTTGDLELTFTGHSDVVTSIESISPTRFASASWDKSIRIWNIFNYESVAILLGHSDGVNCLQLIDEDQMASGSKVFIEYQLQIQKYIFYLIN